MASLVSNSSGAPSSIKITALSVPIPSDPMAPSLAPTIIPITITSYSLSSAHIWIGIPTLDVPASAGSTPKLLNGLVATFPPSSLSPSSPPASSHLISSSDEDETVTTQISYRLAKRTGWPIFLSMASYDSISSQESDFCSAGVILAKVEKAIAEAVEEMKGGGVVEGVGGMKIGAA